MTDAREAVLDILRKAYQIEVDGYTFYSLAADRADKPAVQELFGKLARDEVEHQAYLKGILRSYDEKGVAAFRGERHAPDLKAFSSKVFTEQFKQQAHGASFEMGALSVGMQLESRAVSFFNQAATAASDAEVQGFYRFLADWEKEHFDALQSLYEGVRQDFWADGRFSPF
jgi:rubrerythrin